MAPFETGSNSRAARPRRSLPDPSPLRFSSLPPESTGTASEDGNEVSNEVISESDDVDDDNNEEDAKDAKDATDEQKDWYWQCHLCAHINHLPFLFRDFSLVPFTLTQPCTNTQVPVPVTQPIAYYNTQPQFQYQCQPQQYYQTQQHHQQHVHAGALAYTAPLVAPSQSFTTPLPIAIPHLQPLILQDIPYAIYHSPGAVNPVPAYPSARTPTPTPTPAPALTPIPAPLSMPTLLAPAPQPSTSASASDLSPSTTPKFTLAPNPHKASRTNNTFPNIASASAPAPAPAPHSAVRSNIPAITYPAGIDFATTALSFAFATADNSRAGPAQPVRYRGVTGVRAWPAAASLLPVPTRFGSLWRDERIGEGRGNGPFLRAGGGRGGFSGGGGGYGGGRGDGGLGAVGWQQGEQLMEERGQWKMTACTHTRCEGCYDLDEQMRVVRFCGGSEVDARYYEMWRGSLASVPVMNDHAEKNEEGEGDVMHLRGGEMRGPWKQRDRQRSPVRYMVGESRILVVRSERVVGVEGEGEEDGDDEDESGDEGGGHVYSTKASSDEGEGFFGQTDVGTGEEEQSGDESHGGSHGWLEPITCVHRNTQDEGGCGGYHCDCRDEEVEEKGEEENDDKGVDGDDEREEEEESE